MYAAINEGMRRAKGEWLTYINGDDLLYADAILAALEEYGPRADFIYGNLDHIDLHGRFLFSWRSPAPQRLTWLMQHYCPFPQQGMLFRREAFEKLEGFDLRFRFSADYDFFLRAVEHGCRFSKWTQSSVAAFRLSPGQLSQRLRGEMAPEGRVIREGLRMRRPGMNARFGRMAATLYRWCTNADSMLLRAWRGRNQDAAWRR
jgi:glycosyltransferase involved in cell wall biosynthesis